MFLLTKKLNGYIYFYMARQITIRRCINIDLKPEEAEILDIYLEKNALKLKALTKILLLREIETKGVINSAGYTPPRVEECLIKSKR